MSFCLILTVALSACDRPSPEQLRARNHLPAPGFVASADQGNILFHEHCARCHGAEGSGTPQGPALVSQTYRPGHHSDLSFHWAVKNGVTQHHWKFGNMPPQPQISPEDAANIVAYIRRQQRKKGIQ